VGSGGVAAGRRAAGTAVAPVTLADVAAEEEDRLRTGIGELDRVLGGGIVPGATILLSGEPGVGKSTLLLEVASKAAAGGMRVLYVTAEESVSQVRLRAQRTGALQPELFLAAETDLATILGHIQRGGVPSAFDRVLATRLGMAAIGSVVEGYWGTMVALKGTDIEHVGFQEALGKLKTVPQNRYDEAAVLFG